MKTIAIDGACRRNGSPDCVSAGACFILIEEAIEQSFISTSYETESTSQRGELCGLLLALENTVNNPTDTVIVTDSEYIFNTITKEWVARWRSTGWLTAEGTPVKNQDLWDQIWLLYTQVKDYVTMFHIKGHLLSVGIKKYHDLMYEDTSGYTLYTWAKDNRVIKEEKLAHALVLSETNNGFKPDLSLLQKFAAMNITADAAANLCVENYEAAQWRSMINL